MSDNSNTAVTELPEVQISKMMHNAVGSYLEPGSEAIHQVNIAWWIDETRLNIEPRWQSVGGSLFRQLRWQPCVHLL
ncbi:hypothetical protein ACSBR1_014416 [Camellia fascicularis]